MKAVHTEGVSFAMIFRLSPWWLKLHAFCVNRKLVRCQRFLERHPAKQPMYDYRFSSQVRGGKIMVRFDSTPILYGQRPCAAVRDDLQ